MFGAMKKIFDAQISGSLAVKRKPRHWAVFACFQYYRSLSWIRILRMENPSACFISMGLFTILLQVKYNLVVFCL